MGIYDQAMARHGRVVAQVLLTRSEIAAGAATPARQRPCQLLDWEVLPIVMKRHGVVS